MINIDVPRIKCCEGRVEFTSLIVGLQRADLCCHRTQFNLFGAADFNDLFSD